MFNNRYWLPARGLKSAGDLEQEAHQQNWQRVLDLSTEFLRFAPDNEAAAADCETGTKSWLF